MRNNPRLMFTLSLLLAAAGGATWIAAGVLLPSPSAPTTPLLAKLVYGAGILGLALGLMFAVRPGLKLLTLRRLERGENLLGQWRVGPGDLARFRDADAARGALCPSLRNWLTFPAAVPAAGLPITISEGGMLIGNEMHGIGTNNGAPTVGMLCEAELIEGMPAMLELTHGKTALHDPTGSGMFDQERNRPFWVMRVPVPAEARAAAERAVAALDAAIWKINRDWARLTYAEHFAIADRDRAGRDPALAEAARTPEPAPDDKSPEAQAFAAVAAVFGLEAAKAPTRDTPAYRKGQAQFFGGVLTLASLFGIRSLDIGFDTDFRAAMSVIWAVFFFVALWFTLRGGYHYLYKRGN